MIILKEMPLAECVAAHGTKNTARALSLHHSAIKQMLDKGRQIYVKTIDGKLHYCEYRDWKRGKPRVAV